MTIMEQIRSKQHQGSLTRQMANEEIDRLADVCKSPLKSRHSIYIVADIVLAGVAVPYELQS